MRGMSSCSNSLPPSIGVYSSTPGRSVITRLGGEVAQRHRGLACKCKTLTVTISQIAEVGRKDNAGRSILKIGKCSKNQASFLMQHGVDFRQKRVFGERFFNEHGALRPSAVTSQHFSSIT